MFCATGNRDISCRLLCNFPRQHTQFPPPLYGSSFLFALEYGGLACYAKTVYSLRRRSTKPGKGFQGPTHGLPATFGQARAETGVRFLGPERT